MTGRYYQRDYEEAYYIFDSEKVPENEFDERIEYDCYDVFCDSLTSEEILKLLNENAELKEERDYFEKKKCQYQKKMSILTVDKIQIKETLAYRSNQLALLENLINDLGHEEMRRQMEEILND